MQKVLVTGAAGFIGRTSSNDRSPPATEPTTAMIADTAGPSPLVQIRCLQRAVRKVMSVSV